MELCSLSCGAVYLVDQPIEGAVSSQWSVSVSGDHSHIRSDCIKLSGSPSLIHYSTTRRPAHIDCVSSAELYSA